MDELLALVPAPGEPVRWQAILDSALRPWLLPMADTPQNPVWHGEGDVLTHTRMVCEALVALPGWRALAQEARAQVFVAALLHDVGKPACTRQEGGAWVSPNHGVVGAQVARTLLWQAFGLGGTQAGMQWREAVCGLIRFHSAPLHAADLREPTRRLARIAALGETAPGFRIAGLCLLSQADVRGRIAADTDRQLEQIGFFAELAAEAGCLHAPFAFADAFSRHAFLCGRNVVPGQPLYNDTWGTVILLAGLPGTGKDTYAKQALAHLPMVSLDALRREMGVSPTAPQGGVANAGKELAMGYLRKHQPFVWNATNLTAPIREKQVALFERYGAFVEIVYLETGWEECRRRNQSRAEAVPEGVLEHLMERVTPPTVQEAHAVRWLAW